jgi:ribonuclease P protein component
MNNEADLSAQQSGACSPSRLPRADGDCGRPVGDPGASRARSEEAVGLIHTEGCRTVTTLVRRSDFVAANGGKRAPMPGFVLLVRDRDDGDPAMRVGFTVTKKIGNAVVRNRMKRRFRALAHELLPAGGIGGADHVLIGREGGIERPFESLRAELAKALARIASGQSARPRPPRPKGGKPRRGR